MAPASGVMRSRARASPILPSEIWIKLGIGPRKSSNVCILTAPLVERNLPIRLRHTPATFWVRPVAGIKLGIGRRLYITGDAEQRAESVERVEARLKRNVNSLR